MLKQALPTLSCGRNDNTPYTLPIDTTLPPPTSAIVPALSIPLSPHPTILSPNINQASQQLASITRNELCWQVCNTFAIDNMEPSGFTCAVRLFFESSKNAEHTMGHFVQHCRAPGDESFLQRRFACTNFILVL